MTIIFVNSEYVNAEQLKNELGPEFKVVPVQVPTGRMLHEVVFVCETTTAPSRSL